MQTAQQHSLFQSNQDLHPAQLFIFQYDVAFSDVM